MQPGRACVARARRLSRRAARGRSQDLPEYFEDNLADWMAHFTALLKYANPQLDADEDDSEPSVLSCLQAEVVDCFALLMSKEEEVASAPAPPPSSPPSPPPRAAVPLAPHRPVPA